VLLGGFIVFTENTGPLLAGPEITFLLPNFTTVEDGALYVNDLGNERIVRAVLEYRAEETARVP